MDDLRELLDNWRRHRRALNRSPATIASYQRLVRTFVHYVEANGMPTRASNVRRRHGRDVLGHLADRVSAATVAKHYGSPQQLSRWLVEDVESPRSPMERMRAPAVPVPE